MKTRVILTILMSTLLIVLAGCAGEKEPEKPKASETPETSETSETPDTPDTPDTSDTPAAGDVTQADIIAAIDKMKLENAPTLSSVMREWTMALINKNYDKAWDLMSISTHESATRRLGMYQQSLEAKVNNLETELNDPAIPEESKAEKREQYEGSKKVLEELKAIEGDGKKFFVWVMKRVEKMENSFVASVAKGRIEVLSENIEGDTGYIVHRRLEEDTEKKWYFTRENDGWKFDLNKSIEEEEKKRRDAE